MQAKIKVFEDYEIINDYIYPIGNYQEKTLNDSNIKDALKQFLNIKDKSDIIKFTKKYGLLNGYKFHIKWQSEEMDDDLSWMDTEGKHALRKTIAKDTITIAQDNITQQDKLAYLEYKKELEKSKSLWDEFEMAPDIYVRVLVSGNIFSMLCSHISDTCRGITSGHLYRMPIEEDLMEDYIMNNAFMSQHIHAVNSFLDELYSYDKNQVNDNFVYSLVSEKLGLGIENDSGFYSWISYKQHLLKYRSILKILHNKNATKEDLKSDIYNYYNKTFSYDVKLQHTITPNDEGYDIKPIVVFNNLYDVFEWLIGSLGNSVKVCSVCGKVFFSVRSDASVCSNTCQKRKNRAENKKSNSSSQK